MFDVILYVIHVSIRGYHEISCVTKWVQWPSQFARTGCSQITIHLCLWFIFQGGDHHVTLSCTYAKCWGEKDKLTRGMIPECTISPLLISLHLASPHGRDYSVEVDRKAPMNGLSRIPLISGLQSSVEWNLKDKPVLCYIDLLSSWSRRLSN